MGAPTKDELLEQHAESLGMSEEDLVDFCRWELESQGWTSVKLDPLLPYRLIHISPHHTSDTEVELAKLHALGYRLKFVGSDSYGIQDRPLLVGVMVLERDK